jgi:predicted RNA-binding Zn-ribbon protein involved in translation (DUF1610 family)
MMPNCPKCGKTLDVILYTEYGAKRWDSKKKVWVEDDFRGDAEFYCPECDYRFTHEELEEIGIA